MDNLKALITRYRQVAFLVFGGLILIIYISLGFVYLQQDPQQQELQTQITKLNLVLRTPMPSGEALKAEYDLVNQKLAPIADNVTILMLVNLAQQSGIDISEEDGKFQVPVPSHSTTTLGGISYDLLSFKGIQLQGDYDKVMACISALDSGALLENMVLTRASIQDVEVEATGAEAERRAEFRSIIAAVKEMMADNRLVRIPHPVSFNLGKATNIMGYDPLISPTFEGFPDYTTTAAEKGYTGNASPKQGYMLWEHDKISSDNTTLYTTTNYTQSSTTIYYYTAEENGNVRQFSGPDVSKATEYTDSGPTKMELRASLDIDIYFRPQ